MYASTIAATAVALAGSAIAQSLGSAVVINSCDYPVYLQNTPSAGGGFSEVSQTLDTGASYTQQWTELSNGNGWSLKLSKEDGAFQDNVMQYEYTWHGWDGAWGGVIWFDLSDVNGNPWDGNWELTATGDCSPRQAAYQYSTDDAYGMQDCPGGSSITVELCSGNTGGSAPAPSSGSLTAPVTSIVSALESTSTETSTGPFSPFGGHPGALQEAQRVNENSQKKHTKVTPTTMATVVSSAVNRGGVTVTEVATQVVTSFVTATAAAPNKRHEHVARHAHHHHF